MNNFPKLNLKGIKVGDLTPKAAPKPIVKPLIIDTPKIVSTTPSANYSNYGFIFGLIIFIYILNITVSWSVQHPQIETHRLRKMLRMKCASSDTETQCSSPQEGGDYVVNLGKCKNVYEFNGIPFVEIKKDIHGNYRVPSTSDLTLILKEACTDATATMDTSSTSYKEYASRAYTGNDKKIKKLIWVTNKCYTEFTVKISDIVIFDKTPESMIEQEQLVNKKAYIYLPDEDITGSISIDGNGCEKPIFIYTLRY